MTVNEYVSNSFKMIFENNNHHINIQLKNNTWCTYLNPLINIVELIQ